jgi:mono/diheme cytochrome c family protein
MSFRYLLPLLLTSSVCGGDLTAVFHTYCSGCHTGTTKSVSGPLLDKFDTERIREDREAWARAYRHLQAGTMPPVGAKRPDRATADAALKAIEDAVASDSTPAVSGAEVAKRLAKLLWNCEPDKALA